MSDTKRGVIEIAVPVDEPELVLAAIAAKLEHIEQVVTAGMERVESLAIDLAEFSERFEEVVDRLEQERRADWGRDDG